MAALALLAVAAVASAQPAAPAGARSVSAGAALMETIRALTAPGMDGREVGSPGGAKARDYIEGRLTAAGLPPAGTSGYRQTFAVTTKAGVTRTGTNLITRCEGRHPDRPALVVSAHYDHLGVRGGQVYHGADDNASGVALALHLAERCAATPFDRPLIFAFFDAEELGLLGAQAFVKAPPVPVNRLALNLNFDMVSRSDRQEIFVAGPGRWPVLGPLLKPVAEGAPIAVRFGHDTGGGHDDWTAQSDHGAFHAAGIPFVYLGVEDHADYHQPSDTPDKITPAFLEGVATVAWRLLSALDRAPSFR
ncbi:MAG: M28 family peptidase [Vicinamibacterales bacterium]